MKHAEVKALSKKEFKHLQDISHFLQITSPNILQPSSYPFDLAYLLVDFFHTFKQPTHVPLRREHDHYILL